MHCRTLRAAASRARRIPALSPSGNRISYSYDGAAQASLDHSFAYDNLDRLTSWTQNTTSHGYSYDATGNRTQFTVGATAYTNAVASTSNRLNTAQYNSGTATATRSFTYDAAGNAITLTSTGNEALTLTISDRGRLKSTAKTVSGTAKTISYLYNGLEQRVKKSGPTDQVDTGNQYYVYDEAGHLLGEYDNTLKVVQETVYLNDTPVATLKQTTTGTAPNITVTTTVHYVYADQIDTPRIITRASDNKMVWRWDGADPFGQFAPNQNPAALGTFTHNPRFPGQLFDKESNLHYNVNRDYDAQTGRYVQSDPIGLSGGLGTYSYVFNQPTRYVDVDGKIIVALPWVAPPVIEGLIYIGSAAGAAWAAHKLSCESDSKKEKCIDKCSKLALPTSDYGISFQRCMLACMSDGSSGFPEWDNLFK